MGSYYNKRVIVITISRENNIDTEHEDDQIETGKGKLEVIQRAMRDATRRVGVC